MSDVIKTQHYSNNNLLVDGFKELLPQDGIYIEPFYGEGDLAKALDITFNEYYDIESKEPEHKRDTLLNPPDYTDKWVITNPPYLAKNKAKDKTLFNIYPYDDLYKIAMSTMNNALGGILIIPINFLTDERSASLRDTFLKQYDIVRLNIYLDSMFDNTDYNVCSFFFKRKTSDSTSVSIDTHIYEEKKEIENFVFTLNKEYSYRIGGEFFNDISAVKPIFSRVTETKRDNPTHINIVCIDKTNEPLHFYYDETPYYGKQTDRNIATLSFNGELEPEFEKQLIDEANKYINDFRALNHNLCFTNYRDRHRKRIGFTEAYQIMTVIYNKLKAER